MLNWQRSNAPQLSYTFLSLSRMDANGDGIISYTERKVHDAAASRSFKTFDDLDIVVDTDGDGVDDRRSKGVGLDTDGDGVISYSELKQDAKTASQSIDAWGDRSSKRQADLDGPTSLYHSGVHGMGTGEMDTNNDGVLQHEEFLAMLELERAKNSAR